MQRPAALNSLCDACRQIFQGCWMKRPDHEIDVLCGDEQGTLSDEDMVNDEMSDASSHGSQFYEKPDWVKRVSVDGTEEALLASPLHYSIMDLEASARDGCHLCTIIWDRVRDQLRDLSETAKARLQHAVGVVICRPEFDPADDEVDHGPQPLALEVSYFVDGESEKRSAYIFTVGFDIQVTGGMSPKSLATSSDCSELPDPDRHVSDCTINSIKRWIEDCVQNHQECHVQASLGQTKSKNDVLPTRLLDMIPSRGPDFVTLEETTNMDLTAQYMTLSHCWGAFLPTRLLKNFYEGFKEGILLNDLPRTFQHAIDFTRRLQVRYLWIDALCIIQDSQDDWLHEALLMSSVYSNSRLNLAATSSSDGHGGLYHARHMLLTVPCIVTASWEGFGKGTYQILDESAWRRRVNDGPLNHRAWVLQERLLTSRTAHFAYDQIWWECHCERASEAFPDGVPDSTLSLEPDIIKTFSDLRPSDSIDSNEKWLQWVKAYTKTDLTKNSDKLVAIAGIATTVQRMLDWPEADYLAGMWRQDLAADLLWRAAGVGTKIQPYVAPSWSWASVKGEIYFHSSEDRNVVRSSLAIRILKSNVTPVTGAMGPVKYGCLTIHGPLHRILLSEPDVSIVNYPRFEKLTIGVTSLSGSSAFEDSLDDDRWYHEWQMRERRTYFCRFMTTSTPHLEEAFVSEGLLFEPTGVQPGQYHRIGWLRMFLDDAQNIVVERSDLSSDEYIEMVDNGNYIFDVV